jgi:Heavy metal associated domain 2
MKIEKDIQVVHALPDRVRLKLHRLKNNMAYADEIQRRLHNVQGITHLETNPKTGSLLIQYDPTVLEVLALHPSVSSCLGLPPSDVKQLKKAPPPAKGRAKPLKTVRKTGTKIKGKAKPDKSSKKTRGKS